MAWLDMYHMVAMVTVITRIMLTRACDEALCASLVSKCLLLKSCECNMVDKANCTCCKECSRCLSKLYMECCDCVGMCRPKNHNMYKESIERASSIEELSDPLPDLFSALTEEEDPERRWTIYMYPAHLDLLYFQPHGIDPDINLPGKSGPPKGHRRRHSSQQIHVTLDPSTEAMNCSVAYHSQCMSLNKCRGSCESMGAARYRWFHQYGCCECIGSTCLDYGKGEPLCRKCPAGVMTGEDTGYYYNEYYDEYVYGEEPDRRGSYGEPVEDEEDDPEEDDDDEDDDEEDVKDDFGMGKLGKQGQLGHAVNSDSGFK